MAAGGKDGFYFYQSHRPPHDAPFPLRELDDTVKFFLNGKSVGFKGYAAHASYHLSDTFRHQNRSNSFSVNVSRVDADPLA